MLIKIDHIAKMEGHTGFMASVLEGDVEAARLEIQEGIRLIEGVLIGRKFYDVPIIAQRICGICPVVHNLTAIKAVESAFGIKVSNETVKLRKLLELGQIIHSHGLHLFFLSLADFLDMENDIRLIKEYPEETKWALKIREFGMSIVREIGGRVVHPLTNEVGGFKKIPSEESLKKMIEESQKALDLSLKLGEFFLKIKLPEFSRETEYVALFKKGEYAFYDGSVVSSKGLNISVEKFENNFNEFQRQLEVVKRVERKGKSYMTGAIARVNLGRDSLNVFAHEYLEKTGHNFPDYNPFHNITHQMVEVIHSIEEARRILNELVGASDLSGALTKNYQIKEGVGVAAVEAPRGILYYHLDIDDKGYVRNANIITPTAQALGNLEDDIAAYIPSVVDLDEKSREKKLRAFIRAYDPCISCAVH